MMRPARFATVALVLVILGLATMFVAGMFLTTVAASATQYGV